jgi:hypothetical protein
MSVGFPDDGEFRDRANYANDWIHSREVSETSRQAWYNLSADGHVYQQNQRLYAFVLWACQPGSGWVRWVDGVQEVIYYDGAVTMNDCRRHFRLARDEDLAGNAGGSALTMLRYQGMVEHVLDDRGFRQRRRDVVTGKWNDLVRPTGRCIPLDVDNVPTVQKRYKDLLDEVRLFINLTADNQLEAAQWMIRYNAVVAMLRESTMNDAVIRYHSMTRHSDLNEFNP